MVQQVFAEESVDLCKELCHGVPAAQDHGDERGQHVAVEVHHDATHHHNLQWNTEYQVHLPVWRVDPPLLLLVQDDLVEGGPSSKEGPAGGHPEQVGHKVAQLAEAALEAVE